MAQFLQPKSSISIKEARKLLGLDASSLDDNQVRDIVVVLQLLARQHFSSVVPRKRVVP